MFNTEQTQYGNMKGLLIIIASILFGLAWWLTPDLLGYFFEHPNSFRYMVGGILLLILLAIGLGNVWFTQKAACEQHTKIIENQQAWQVNTDTRLQQALSEKKALEAQLESLQVDTAKMATYQERLNKMSHTQQRLKRDLEKARNRIAHFKDNKSQKKKKHRETTLDSSTA